MILGLLTGGGDCPGLNAAIRAVVRSAIVEKEYRVMGFLQGWKGLMDNLNRPLDIKDVSGILPMGGTILGASRTNPRRYEKGFERIEDTLKKNNIDALAVIGDYDCQSVALELSRRGFPVVGVPATMDNNIGHTDNSIGFNSSVAVVTDALDKLHTTASAHHRVMILQVMGRYSGWVALFGGLAGGADWIIIPEVQSHFRDIIEHLKTRWKIGKYFSIIVVAEGAKLPEIPMADIKEKDEFGNIRLDRRNIGMAIGEHIEKMTGFETRVTVLGHLQRGGSPAALDRILATRLGKHAVDMISSRKFGQMAIYCSNKLDSVHLEKVVNVSPRGVSIKLYNTAQVFY